MKITRSALYVPGNHEQMTLKVFNYGADEVIFDLEDAVPVHEKATAREITALRIKNKPSGNYLSSVRINSVDTNEALLDLQVVVMEGVDCIHLAKVESKSDIVIVDWIINQLEQQRKIPSNSIELVPIIETPKGYINRKEIVYSSNRIKYVAFGLGDFMAQTRISPKLSDTVLLSLKSNMVIENMANGLIPPMDVVYPNVLDDEGFIREAELARMAGLFGKICIHPRQVQLANDIFTPDENEIAKAQRIVQTFSEKESMGTASFTIDGELIDYAALEHAKIILEMASQVKKV